MYVRAKREWVKKNGWRSTRLYDFEKSRRIKLKKENSRKVQKEERDWGENACWHQRGSDGDGTA